MQKLPELNNLLAYRNPLVIKRFLLRHPELQEEVQGLFLDMLRYLWLSQKYNLESVQNPERVQGFNCVMHREMTIIDEMWHTFILITKDYARFCEDYFGEFLHHVPNMVDETAPIDLERFENKLALFLSYVYDNLGEATVKSWFADYVDEPVAIE